LKSGDEISHQHYGVADKFEFAEDAVGDVGDEGYIKEHVSDGKY
jgi:hypothetical protein